MKRFLTLLVLALALVSFSATTLVSCDGKKEEKKDEKKDEKKGEKKDEKKEEKK